MFTGIIEQQAKVEEIVKDQSNVHFRLSSLFQNELKVDQSVAHNGVCLTLLILQMVEISVFINIWQLLLM